MNKLECQSASDIIIFGALGDLSRRKLLPALYQLEVCDCINEKSRIIGIARSTHSIDNFKDFVIENLHDFIEVALDEDVLARFVSRFVYCSFDIKDVTAYENLAKILSDENSTRVYYFSTPSDVYGDICDGLNHSMLISTDDRVVMEKPIGHCLISSKKLMTK